MRRSQRGFLFVVSISLCALVGSPAPVSADIPVAGQHNTTTKVILEFGPYADYATRIHVIAKGDTLDAIAKADASIPTAKAILDLNPGLEPTKLGIGTRLVLPPRKEPLPAPKSATRGEAKPVAPVTGRQHRWWLYSLPSPHLHLTPFGDGEEVPVAHYGTTVFAVRHDMHAEFLKQFSAKDGGTYRFIDHLKKSRPAWFAVASGIDAGRGSVKDSSPIYRIEKRMRITRIEKGNVHTTTLATRYFDKNGKELSKAAIRGASNRWNFLLILLAAGGIAGLVFVLRRRSQEAAAPSAA